MVAYVRQLLAFAERPTDVSDEGGGAIRDAAMADNLAALMRELYPGKKILVWAHNFHVRHANAATASVQKTMGAFTVAQFRDDLYTIGLYMNRGQAAFNDRSIYVINPAPAESLEWVLFNVGPPAVFVDFLQQSLEPGNEWIFYKQFRSRVGAVSAGPRAARSIRRRAVHRSRNSSAVRVVLGRSRFTRKRHSMGRDFWTGRSNCEPGAIVSRPRH